MMTRMRYVRHLDVRETVNTQWPGHRAQLLSHLESALAVASHIDEGSCGPDLHYHRGDKLYYVLQGSMSLRLGDDIHQVEADSLVFVPAGLAHRNWNDGPGTESHFEMIIPAPPPTATVDLLVDAPADVPAEHRADRPAYLRTVDRTMMFEALPGTWVQSLAGRESGSQNALMHYVEVWPGHAGPDTYIHEFDQYYLVLQGQLTVEVALQPHVVAAGSLVVVPAGVPYRHHNNGHGTERHLAVISAQPEPGQSVERTVLFALKEPDSSVARTLTEQVTVHP
jgi:quercetin dioxygenase-like cupin family protein